MSVQLDAYGNPANVGDPGRGDEEYATDGVADTIRRVRELGLYELLRQRLVREVPLPTPAAGAELIATVPAGTVWEPLSLAATFTASAAVATRLPAFTARDPAGVAGYVVAGAGSATASAVIRYTWMTGLGVALTPNQFQSPLPSPPIAALDNWTIRTVTTNIDVGDTWTAAVLLVREWSVGQVYWAADLIGRELGFEALTDLPATTPLPVEIGQPIPVSPIAR